MTFYVAEKNARGSYISTVAPGGVVTYTSDIDYAIWSTDSYKVQNVIDAGNIPNVTATLKNGVHPSHRPPL